MPRVSNEELERLKKDIPILKLVEAQGIKLQPHGRNFIGLCPFHDDKEPSLVITPEKNLFNCLGACGSGGTVIDWVMKAEKLSFREAVSFLQSRSGIGSASAVVSSQAAAKASSPAAAPISFSAADHELLLQTVDYYHKTLKETPEAIAYLEKRGIYSPEIIDRFKIGYSNRSFGLNLPVKQVKSGLEIRTRLQKLGLFRDSGHEHFAGSVTFPIFDAGGNVVEIYGRKIRNNLRGRCRRPHGELERLRGCGRRRSRLQPGISRAARGAFPRQPRDVLSARRAGGSDAIQSPCRIHGIGAERCGIRPVLRSALSRIRGFRLRVSADVRGNARRGKYRQYSRDSYPVAGRSCRGPGGPNASPLPVDHGA